MVSQTRVLFVELDRETCYTVNVESKTMLLLEKSGFLMKNLKINLILNCSIEKSTFIFQ